MKEGFVEDPRYKQAAKEAKIGLGLFFLNILWWFGFCVQGPGAKPAGGWNLAACCYQYYDLPIIT
ncbi:MAG: hypothetical protein AB1447_03225 [Bacillota bacterium]